MGSTATMDRRQVLDELLQELTAHTPAGIMRHMRRWPSGPLSLVHLHVLMVLDQASPLPMGALAESLDVSQASATGIVDRMEQRGLVERRRDDEDRRVIRVALTEAGRELIGAVATERRELLATMLDQLTDQELEGFLRGARALRVARERLHEKLTQDDPPGGVDPNVASGATVPYPESQPAVVHAQHSAGEASR